jgi:hypothetical protein
MSIEKVKQLANEATVYIPEDCESIRIEASFSDEGYFCGIGEESGEGYQIEFTEVDLDNDMFYKLVLMENK